jgi:hypothetical protein
MLEKLATEKHSRLLQKLVNYGQKSFIILGLGQILETIYFLQKVANPAVTKPKLPVT